MGHAEKDPGAASSKEKYQTEDFAGVWSGQGDPIESPHRDAHGDLSVEEAAKILGITTKAVIKRLQRKTLPGKKVEVKGVEQWRVLPGDWTRDALVQEENKSGDTEGSPAGYPLSREDLNAVLERLEELQDAVSRPQISIDRGSEVEDLQRQLIGAQQIIMKLQGEYQTQALRIVQLENELKQLPDLEVESQKQATSAERLFEEKSVLETELEKAKQELETEKNRKWWQRLW